MEITMKKLFFLFALICAGQLYGMEKEGAVGIYTSVLPEIKQQILNAALASSENVDEAIDAIKKFSVLRGVQFDKLFNNFQDFIKVVNLVSEKFPELTKSAIAEKVNPLFAKEYDALNMKLIRAVRNNESIEVITQLLNQGADINFCWRHRYTPLTSAIVERVDIVELLLSSGANPFFVWPGYGLTALGVVNNGLAQPNNDPVVVEKLNKMKALLENAMKK
jgi:hypothetical protein